MLNTLIWLVPALPIFAALWIGIGYLAGFNRGEIGEQPTAQIAISATAISLILMLVLDASAIMAGNAPGQIALAPWLTTGSYQVLLSFTLDNLSLAMATLVALISLLMMRFSVNYMHREAGFQRFFMIMSLFSGAMLLIVTAGNAVFAFIGWELAGVSSYLLIGYAFDRPTATQNATRAFVTNRIGDAGFIMAIFLSFSYLGGIEWPLITSEAHDPDGIGAGLIAGGFLLAALAKSAQVPFSPWIARALEGPTPSSAIFYGALMVHAGVYLVVRLQPLFEQSPMAMAALIIFGLLTMLYGYFGSLVQTDVKSVLIFSVTTHVGLMFLLCGLGLFEVAVIYMVLHAVWRAWQFLTAPSMMHDMVRPTRPVPAWLAKRRAFYTACLQRFWLDNLADALFVRPTQGLARDAQRFDEKVVNQLAGLPGSANALSSLAEWENRKGVLVEGEIGRGSGVFGKIMEWIASGLHWFEEHLVLKSGGEGLLKLIRHIGAYLTQIEMLLSQPRYLILLIAITFIVII
ncbi:hypothetical protein BOW53_14830 [Solemya pervernicosa gill symbiont]|uniref:NADH-quinone oxidoreductase subunit L n=2 Tax=Gammaproteobacteria incertae sedis TaxID=118884 RepID=A0A1T2L0P3_9GAMM|nr:proton-conducting transporter membrane subunit [Candidatus Reidiella endopervernicosa]OOZ38634.1 hypothetical protein BOW53_14830 [Solemya pervernicosa gill symbiont]QKQ26849.1 hypothetical protein HUE57_11595 [Candidatus Reidiella endopervernicosa]